MKKLKIAFVFDDSLDKTDGVQQYVLTLGAWLSAQGHEVHYLVGQTARTDLPNVHSLSRNVNVRFNGNRMSIPLPANGRRIRALLRREQFDVLHVQVPYSPFLAQKIIAAADKATVVIGTFHIAPHSGLVHQANRVLGLWTRRTLKRFDKMLSVSTAAADFAKSTFGVDSEVLPNVIEQERFRDATQLLPPSDRPTVMFLGRLVPRKGCRLLLEAIVKLRDDAPAMNPRVVICGRGPLEQELRAYVAAHGLDDSVEFTGFVSEEDKPRYLKSADVAVFPSSGGESFGIVLIESMAADHPVVLGADNPGYASVLGPYPDLLFPVNDSTSLANKLHVFLTEPGPRRRALDWQQAYVGQFDVRQVGLQLVAFYEQLLHSRRDVQ